VSQARFQKQQREKARREKAAAKFARKEQRRSDADSAERVEPEGGVTEAGLLAELAALHERFANEELTFDDFTVAKDELMERISAFTA
jgi:hypothetical protein